MSINVTQEKFEAYEKVRVMYPNTLDTKAIMSAAKLSFNVRMNRKEIEDIFRNYKAYKTKFNNAKS